MYPLIEYCIPLCVRWLLFGLNLLSAASMSVTSCTRHAAAISRRIPTTSTYFTPGRSAWCRSAISRRSISSMSNETQHKVYKSDHASGSLVYVLLDALSEPGRGRPRGVRDNPEGKKSSLRPHCCCSNKLMGAQQEKRRQKHFINLIPSENFTSQAVLDALGSVMQSK